MQVRRQLLRNSSSVFIVALTCIISACNYPQSNMPSDNGCIVDKNGTKLFIGEPDCMRKLPAHHMSGLWVLGHERSIFYEGAAEVPKPSEDDVWLTNDPSVVLKPFGLKFDGETHAYKVEFIGTRSDAPGVYGYAGTFKHGAFVLRMLKLKEVDLRRGGAVGYGDRA